MGFVIARIVAIALLFWALDKHPYDYYTMLRLVVCGVTAYGVFFASENKKIGWAWGFGIIAVLFNPIIPVHLDKDTWALIDVMAAIILTVSLFMVRKQKTKREENEENI
ncbi:MAG: DUF6804 family protein [Candidatus Brocadiia bacterium]